MDIKKKESQTLTKKGSKQKTVHWGIAILLCQSPPMNGLYNCKGASGSLKNNFTFSCADPSRMAALLVG